MTGDGTERKRTVIVLDTEQLILDALVERGLDPAEYEIIQSKTGDDDHSIVFELEAGSI